MKQKSVFAIKLLTVLIFSIFLILAVFYLYIFLRCIGAEKNIPHLGELPMMRVQIYGSSIDTVSARIALLDTRGKEFSVLDRSWSGNSLCAEFVQSEFEKRVFLFPLRIIPKIYSASGKTLVNKGAFLPRYYLFDGECAFLDSSFSKKSRTSLYSIAFLAIWQSSKFRSKSLKIQTIDLSSLERGVTYEIIADFSDSSIRLSRM